MGNSLWRHSIVWHLIDTPFKNPYIIRKGSKWSTSGFSEFSREAKRLVCSAGEECQSECSLQRCATAVLEVERVMLEG